MSYFPGRRLARGNVVVFILRTPVSHMSSVLTVAAKAACTMARNGKHNVDLRLSRLPCCYAAAHGPPWQLAYPGPSDRVAKLIFGACAVIRAYYAHR
jgi:hypothetical protein